MTHAIRYETKYHWWGPGPAPLSPLPLRDLIDNRTIDMERVVTLWAALANGRSLTIIGGPSGLGKSTLLNALLPALPAERRQCYLRGCYESFAFERDSGYAPLTTTLLINELSPHLPIYLWGPAVHRALAAGEAGCQILATAHGRSVIEFVAPLTGSPLRIPAPQVAALDLLVLLEPTTDGSRGVAAGLWQLAATRNGLAVEEVRQGDFPVDLTRNQLDAAHLAVLTHIAQD